MDNYQVLRYHMARAYGRTAVNAYYDVEIYIGDVLESFHVYESAGLTGPIMADVLHKMRSIRHHLGVDYVQAAIYRNNEYIGCLYEGNKTRQYLFRHLSWTGTRDQEPVVSYFVIEK